MSNEVIRRIDHERRELLPLPQLPEVRVRDATPGSGPGSAPGSDLAFIDRLQKMHSKAVGWMPTKQLEGHIAKGHVLIAEEFTAENTEGAESKSGSDGIDLMHVSANSAASAVKRIGYAIGIDKYFKREDTGIIYQMNIAPGSQRGYVGANLLQAMFDRWPYGVRLCCCWCAQDLGANHFWEAMGFVPLAFRTGSRKRDRVHIFWQKKIRAQDQAADAGVDVNADAQSRGGNNFRGWWYPSQTGAGAIKEDRIVLPIPPGTHWSDAKPRVLPGVAALIDEAAAERKAIQGPVDKQARKRERAAKKVMQAEVSQRMNTVAAGGLHFAPAPGSNVPESGDPGSGATKKKKRSRSETKNDPRLVAAARELRDRWLEKVAAEPTLLAASSSGGKYDASRMLEAPGAVDVTRRLEAA